MGTDIHIYAEVRKNGKWERTLAPVPDDRDYWSFALLAGVRNGHGFAGCDLGDPVNPISEPRGIPYDTTIRSTDTLEWGDPNYCWLGDHSFSWCLLSEIFAIDLTKPHTFRGMVGAEERKRMTLAGTIAPQEYCGWTNSPDYVNMEWQEPIGKHAYLINRIISTFSGIGHNPEDIRFVFGFDS